MEHNNYNHSLNHITSETHPLPRYAEENLLKYYRQFPKERRMTWRLAFYENKEPWMLSRSEYDKLKEIHNKLNSDNQ